MWVLEPNCGPQQERQTLLIAELSIEAQGKGRKTFPGETQKSYVGQ